MSCSLCRLPFTPSPISLEPHPPPPDMLTDKQYQYLRWAVGMGKTIPGNVATFEYLDNNMFGGMRTGLVLNVAWESSWETGPGTVLMFHTACAPILRHLFRAADDSTDALAEICQIEAILGHGLPVPNSGRLRYVRYEDVGERVNLCKFWIPRVFEDRSAFDWTAHRAAGLGWTLTRPDIFPRFHAAVDPERLPGPPAASTDIITRQTYDTLHTLFPYLSTPSFLALTATCRLLRRLALTSLQPQVRTRVLALPWAFPVASERVAAGAAAASMAHPLDSPYDADWILYLSQIHRTKSMRARRWIWALAEDVWRAYSAAKPDSEYADVVDAKGVLQKSLARRELETYVKQMRRMRLM